MPPLCDFCSAPNPGWKYPARSFIGYEGDGVAGESLGDWAACEVCHQFIESGDRGGLTERSAATLIVIGPGLAVIREELVAELSTLHVRFFENRTGPAEAII